MGVWVGGRGGGVRMKRKGEVGKGHTSSLMTAVGAWGAL